MRRLLIFALLVCSNYSYSNYNPIIDVSGYLDVQDLNKKILSLKNDTLTDTLVIKPGNYFIKNNTTINLQNHVFLQCTGVNFKYIWVTDDFKQNIFQFQDVTSSGIFGLTIDFTKAYKDKKPSYANADKFVNRSIIQIEHSNNIMIDGVKILKILGSGMEVSNSWNCNVINCVLNGSWVYGNENGTQGYGINLVGVLCKNNFIAYNVINDCRHAIILQYNCSFNKIEGNNTSNCKGLKKFWIIEIMDSYFCYDLSFHGNLPHDNIVITNICQGNLYVDNIKNIPNGSNNQIIANKVKGRLHVASKAPDYFYNSGQVIKDNEYGSMRIEANDCIVIDNKKIK